MHPDDETPTTSFGLGPVGPPPPPTDRPIRRLGHRGRVVATIAAVTLLATAVVGVGMAFGASDSEGGPDAATPKGGHSVNAQNPKTAAGGRHRPGSADPARQAWAHEYGQDRSSMPNLPDVSSATPQQQAAAADLLSRTQSATSSYADPAKAQAAGFDLQASLARAEQRLPGLARRMQRVDAGATPARMPMLHVVNKTYLRDGKVLDPSAPEALMYEYEGHNTWKLVGVMFVATEAYPQAPPDPGGPITRWHYHDKAGGASLMMHVFFVPGNDLSHAYALTMEGM
jgi:hypothetical protein